MIDFFVRQCFNVFRKLCVPESKNAYCNVFLHHLVILISFFDLLASIIVSAVVSSLKKPSFHCFMIGNNDYSAPRQATNSCIPPLHATAATYKWTIQKSLKSSKSFNVHISTLRSSREHWWPCDQGANVLNVAAALGLHRRPAACEYERSFLQFENSTRGSDSDHLTLGASRFSICRPISKGNFYLASSCQP